MSAITTATAVLAVMFACALTVSGKSPAQENAAFRAERVVRTGHLRFSAPPATVFPLFTPLGELHWAKGWNPTVLYPADGNPVEGLLFYTPDHDGTWWWMTRWDPSNYAVEYHVVSPAGLARNIRVQCAAVANGTAVTVTDTYIGLNEHGNEFVRSLTEEEYARKMTKGWQEPIQAYLNNTK